MSLSKVSMIAGAMALMATSAEAVLSFETVALPEPVQVSLENTTPTENDVEEAMELHSLLHELPMIRDIQVQNEKTQRYYEKNKKALAEMDECNQEQMGRLFQNPDQVWDKMKKAMQLKEHEAVAVVAPGLGLDATDNKAGAATDAMVKETFALWQGGAEILTDVYANPENWGTLKKDGDSFPLWSDQKYWYDKEWDNKYTELNAYFGAPASDRPMLEDQDRYDARHYDKVKEAHEAYLAALREKYPDKARALPSDLALAPQEAPKPLPPFNEIVTYPYDGDRAQEVYPAMPEPWQKFVNSAGQDQNPVGEMAKVYEENGQLSSDVLQGEIPLENRLNAYQQQHKQTDAMQKLATGMSESTAALSADLNQRLEKYGLNQEELNLMDYATYSEIEKALKEKKEAFLIQAESRLKEVGPKEIEADQIQNKLRFMGQEDYLQQLKVENPDYFNFLRQTVMTSQLETDAAVVKALRVDKNAEVEITETNAPDIEMALKQARMQKMQQAKQLKGVDEAMEKMMDRPINDQCLFENRDFDDR